MDFQRGLRLVGEIGRRLPTQIDAHATAQMLYEQLAAALPIDTCTITFPIENHDQQAYTFGAEKEQSDKLDAKFATLAGHQTVELAATTRPRRRSALPDPTPPLLSELSSAFSANGRTNGSIRIGAYTRDAYAASDQQLLDAIAQLIETTEIPRPSPTTTERDALEHPADASSLDAIATALGSISATISEEYPPAQVHAFILEQAADLVPFEQAAIQVFEHGQIQHCTAIGPLIKQLCAEIATRRLWFEYRPLDRSLCSGDPELEQLFNAGNIHDFLSIPVLVGGTLVGRVSFASQRPATFSHYHMQIGLLLAERTAQVIRTTQLQNSLEIMRAKTAQLDIVRHDFVSTVSHQLRTPLTGILGYMELLLNRWNSLDDERRRSMLLRAQSSAVRLEHLVTDLLLFSNLEHQELKVQTANYPLSVLVQQAVEGMGTKFRGQVIEVRPSKTNAVVRADPQRTVQVLSNLLDNAIKYSDIGSPVEVRWITHRNDVEICVRDFGPGIKAEDLPRLFTRFGTLGHHPRPGQIGTGIGLYISKRLLDAMNGRIWATSRLGHGSVFHFTLPASSAEGHTSSQ